MRRLLVLLALFAVGLAGGALALPQQQGSVDLLNQSDGQWDGPGEAQGGSAAGATVVGLGDVFHDGRAALAIGAPEADPGGRLGAGSVYVVAGQAGTGAVDLTALIGRGYRIDGGGAGDGTGSALAPVTLPNGHPGLAIGAPYATPQRRNGAGLVYLVDLTKLRRNVDLSLAPLPKAVVGVLTGPAGCAELGYALAAGPRARGGATSLLVGAPGVDPSGCPVAKPDGPSGGNAGAAYVIAADRLTRRIDLARPQAGVSAFVGAAPGDRAGAAVAGIPGTGAFLIGAPYASPLGRAGAGAVYLLHGAGAARVISLGALPAGATEFDGAAADDALGFAMAATDGFARGQSLRTIDLALGAPQATPKGRAEAGETFLVTGLRHPARVDLAANPAAGVIDGAESGDEAGYALAGLGSMNGSGVPSLAVGAPFANSQTGQDRIDNGAAYVLYGGAGAASVDLAHLRDRGFAAFGARNADEAGSSLAAVSGENGDGRADVLIGAPYAESEFGSSPSEGGAAYVLFGWGTPAVRYRRTSVEARVGRPLAPLVPIVRVTGRATFSVHPALPPGLRLGRSSGRITGTPRAPSPATRYVVQLSDEAGVATVVLTLAVVR